MRRRDLLAAEAERVAIDVQALGARLAAAENLPLRARRHAEGVSSAALVLRDAAVALGGGLTPALRMFFGRKLRDGLYVEADDD